MKKNQIKRLALAGILIAVAVVGSMFSFPVFGSKCSPVQHMVNVIAAVLLGPWYGAIAGFLAALLRNLLGLGSLLAFPGSIFGALVAGLLYKHTKKLLPSILGEVFGTSVIGGLAAYPIAVGLMGVGAETVAFYGYIVPFLISTAVGSAMSAMILFVMDKNGILKKVQNCLY